jgi:nucleotide-binding universal stress UspA family protein
MPRFSHILVPTDFGEPSRVGLDLALELAQRVGAALTLVHSYDVPVYVYEGMLLATTDLQTSFEAAARTQFDEALAELRLKFPAATGLLRNGVTWEQILATAAQVNADLIVMGTHGRKGIKRALLGSVAEKVVRMSPIPVMTTRGEEAD